MKILQKSNKISVCLLYNINFLNKNLYILAYSHLKAFLRKIMGNECDQCEAVTEGCKRQQFRTQLKNREKLDLSRGQTNEKSKSKIDAINNLRNNAFVEGPRNDQNQKSQQELSSIEIIKSHKPPDQQQKNSKIYETKNKTKQKTDNKVMQKSQQKRNHLERESYQESKIGFDDFNFIKLPIESGFDRKNNQKLQQLQRNLLLSRQPPNLMTQKDKKKSQQNLKIIRNSTIRIEESIINQSKFQEDDKQNSTIKKGEIILITDSKWNKKKEQNNDILAQNFLSNSNPSKALKQFNSALHQSPIQPVNRPPKTPINHNDSEIPYDEESFTQPIQAVQQQIFYIKPGVYFQGFISKINKKLQNQGTIIFESDQTQMLVNFHNGNLNHNKNTIIAFSDRSVFQGQVKAENQRGQFMASGQGKFLFPDGSYYVGQWLKNLPHGKGRHKFADGSSYEGEFIEGRKQGQGKFATSQGDLIYIGSFLNNRMQGKGQMTITDPNTGKKRIYKGYFKNGKLQGDNCQALYVDQEAKYIGSFQDGKKCGYGRYYYGDGRLWQGQWKDNRQNGHGKFKNKNGEIIQGYWIDGIKNQNRLSK